MFLLRAFKTVKINIMGRQHFGWIVVVIDLALVSIAVRDILSFPTCFTKGSFLRDQTISD
jgi:hypothetical protein